MNPFNSHNPWEFRNSATSGRETGFMVLRMPYDLHQHR